MLPSVLRDAVGARISRFRSSLLRDTQPTYAPVQRFKCALTDRPRMARGQDGFATPFLYDSFIHYFTPVYPDAIHARVRAPRWRPRRHAPRVRSTNTAATA